MVQRDQGRQELVDTEDAVAQALVVVDEVEVGHSGNQGLLGPVAEGQGLGEHAGRERGELEEVGLGLDLPVGGETAGVVIVEDVETRQLGEGDPLVEHRVGLAGEHLDV